MKSQATKSKKSEKRLAAEIAESAERKRYPRHKLTLARPLAATKIIATKAQRHKEGINHEVSRIPKGQVGTKKRVRKRLKKRAEWQKFKGAEKRFTAEIAEGAERKRLTTN